MSIERVGGEAREAILVGVRSAHHPIVDSRSAGVVGDKAMAPKTHLQRAPSRVATFGQGWMFGHPGPIPNLHLSANSRAIERLALGMTEPQVILSAFQTADRRTRAAANGCTKFASRSAFVGAVGHGLSSEPAAGGRGASLPVKHQMLGEGSVIIVGSRIAHDLGDEGADMQRRFPFAVVPEREMMPPAARSSTLKMTPLTASNGRARLATVAA